MKINTLTVDPIIGRWILNQTTWKTVPKPPKSGFLKTELQNQSFCFFVFEFSVKLVRYPTFHRFLKWLILTNIFLFCTYLFYLSLFWHWLLTHLGRRLVVLVVSVVSLELIIVMMYTPSHNVIEKVESPVCRCDRCGQCLAYSITFPESLCDSYWDVKPCKEHFCCCMCIVLFTVLQNFFLTHICCVFVQHYAAFWM